MSEPTVTCPVCDDTHAAPGGDSQFLARGISRCSICDARIVYGDPAVRVIDEPSTFDTIDGPKPAILIRFQDPKTKAELFSVKLDPAHAFLHAQSLLSMVRP